MMRNTENQCTKMFYSGILLEYVRDIAQQYPDDLPDGSCQSSRVFQNASRRGQSQVHAIQLVDSYFAGRDFGKARLD